MITDDEVAGVLGQTYPGKSEGAADGPYYCTWENPTTYESVSLEIGNADTARNGTLPPPEPGMPAIGTPGPDGMRFLVPGQLEFPAGGRNNSLHIAVQGMSNDQANAAAVDLAKKVGPRVPR